VQTGWLLRDGQVLAAADTVGGFMGRSRGLSRHGDHPGALVLPRMRVAHSLFTDSALDVAFCDAELRVLGTRQLPRWRIAAPRLSCRTVIEARSGSFERWGLSAGDQLEFRPAQ
jgi:uncharacterized membrane protein (UPF0127 family)